MGLLIAWIEIEIFLTIMCSSDTRSGSSHRIGQICDESGAVLVPYNLKRGRDLKAAQANDFLHDIQLTEPEFRDVVAGKISRTDCIKLIEPRLL
jgi:hypothetical protein